MNVMQCMIKDITAIFAYLPECLCVAVIALIAQLIWNRGKEQPHPIGKAAGLFLFVTYFVMIVEISIFSRTLMRYDPIDWKLFDLWVNGAQEMAYTAENVLMFVPFGLLLPFVWRVAQRFFVCVPLGMAVSISIEATQYITKKGFCQLEDVVMNTAGTVIGFICGWMVRGLWKNFKKKG